MGYTLAEKILAAHAGFETVNAGQFVEATVDIVLSNDITAPISIREFKKLAEEGAPLEVFDPERVVMVADHFAPNKDIKSAEQCLVLRQFAREQDLPNHFDVGRMGIEHVLLPEQGLVVPGDLVVGADSVGSCRPREHVLLGRADHSSQGEHSQGVRPGQASHSERAAVGTRSQ